MGFLLLASFLCYTTGSLANSANYRPHHQLCSRSLLPFSSVISCSIPFYFFLSFSVSLSLYLRLAFRRAFPLFSPMLPSVAFIPTPSLYFFFSFLTTSALSVACPFSSSLFPCVTYSSPELGVIGRNSRTSNYRNKIFHPRAAFTHSMFYMFFRLFYTIHPLDLIFSYSIFIFIFFYQRYENKLNFISKFFWIYIYISKIK